MSASILIAGAGGQVGHELAIAHSPHRLIALTRAELDITDLQQVQAVFDEARPNIVINAAAYTQVDRAESEREQAFAINCDGTRNLAIACGERNLPLLHVSTDYIFSGDDEGGYLEEQPPAPKSVYGESKAAGEKALRAELARHVILRTSWVFSANGNNFVKTMLRLGHERPELGIVADQFGCPTSAGSIAQALLQIADTFLAGETVEWGTYHFSNTPTTTWYDFACAVFQQAGGYDDLRLRRITTAEYPTPAVRPMNSELNCDKLQSTFGIRQPDWLNELRQVIEVLKD
jgi:dTDP-4-dehydrorhamnose reductase